MKSSGRRLSPTVTGPFLLAKRWSHVIPHNCSIKKEKNYNNKNIFMCPSGVRNLDWLCWCQSQQKITVLIWSGLLICWWHSPAQSLLASGPAGIMTIVKHLTTLWVVQLLCSVQHSQFQSSPVVAGGPRQHYHSWFRAPPGPIIIFFFCVPIPFIGHKPVGLVKCYMSSPWFQVPRDSGPYFSVSGFLSTALPCTAHSFVRLTTTALPCKINRLCLDVSSLIA